MRGWWRRRGTGAKTAFVVAAVICGGVLAGGLGFRLGLLVISELRPSDAELARTLVTTADPVARQNAATTLAGRHSVQATRDLVAAAKMNPTAAAGLAEVRTAYIADLARVHTATAEEQGDLKQTVRCLAAIGDPESIDALGTLLSGDAGADYAVHVQAVGALGESKAPTAMPHLLEAVTLSAQADPEGTIRIASSDALSAFPEAIEPLMAARETYAADSAVCPCVERALAGIGEPAVGPLIAALGTVGWAHAVLANIGEPALAPAAVATIDKNPVVRYRALSVLLTTYGRDEATVTPHLVDADMAPVLVEARTEAGYGAARDATIESVLTKIGEPAVKPLLAQLGKTDWVQEVLLAIGEPALAPLAEATAHADAKVRYRSLSLLLKTYTRDQSLAAQYVVDPARVAALIEARRFAGYNDDRDATVDSVLAKIGETAVKPLVALVATEGWVDSVLVSIGAPAVSSLMSAMRSKDYNTRMRAADVLIDMQRTKPELVKPLTAALQQGDLGFIADSYAFYIRLGQEGTEDVLTRALNAHGGKQMALDYLNCGNNKLDAAARDWAARHGYRVYMTSEFVSGPQWGEGAD